MNQEINESFYKEIVIPQLKKLLQNIPSEKPDRILNSTDGPSKWRKGWFASVIGYIDMLGIDFFQSNPVLQQRIDNARTSWIKGEFRQKPLTEQSDIDDADELIKEVLAYFGVDSEHEPETE